MTRIKMYFLLILFLITVAICFSSCNMSDRDIENGIVFYENDGYVMVRDITLGAGAQVVIPSKHGGLPVTVLSDMDFYYLDSFGRYETLVLPESIERISEDFYYNASSKLIYNEYGNGLYLGTADNPYFAFIKVKEVKAAELLAFVPSDRPNEPDKAGLPPPIYVENPTDVTSVELHPDTVIIADNAFAGCKKLKIVTVSDKVKRIPSFAFAGCTSLETVDLPEGIEEIGNGAFTDCQSLSYLYIPSTVTVAESIFYRTYSRGEAKLNVVVGEGMTVLPNGLFQRCDILRSVELPESLCEMGYAAFEGCGALASINIPSSVENIEALTFNGCTSLESIVLPENLKTIGHNAFYQCSSLVEISVPNTVESIGAGAFSNCSSLASVKLPPLFAYECGEGVFFDTALTELEIDYSGVETVLLDGSIYTKDMTALITFGGEGSAFTVPDSVIYICENAFRDSTLTEIIMPETIQKIGMMAFYNCDGLVSFTTPEFLKYLGDWCFTDCDSLESFTFCCDIDKFYYCDIFDSCDALKTVRFYGYIESITKSMFEKAPALERIEKPDRVPTPTSGGYYTRDGVLYVRTSYEILVYYPRGKQDKEFSVPDTTRYILAGAFKNNKYLEKLNVSGSLVNINESAFEDCTSLFEVVFSGDGLRVIADGAFKNCVSLTEIVLPSKVDYIGESAFEGCTSLESVVIGERTSLIEDNAFRGCSSLESVKLGERTEFISDGAFLGCYQLEKIVLPSEFKMITGVVFEEQAEIYFDGTKRELKKEITYWGNAKNTADGGYYVNCTDGALWIEHKN